MPGRSLYHTARYSSRVLLKAKAGETSLMLTTLAMAKVLPTMAPARAGRGAARIRSRIKRVLRVNLMQTENILALLANQKMRR